MPETATFDGYSTGLLWRPPDPRNYDMSRIESVQQMLAVGYPDSDEHLKEHCVYIYNQGATPSCTTHFTAGLMTVNEHIERHGETLVFDAMGLFNETGAPNVGRYTGDILKIAQDRGVLRVGTTKRYRIGSYAFSPTTSVEMWVSTIKAAVAAGHMCGLALLLPSSFGWESSGSIVPNSYHQVGIVGYRPDAFLILNSWGAGWGRGGFGWVPIQFLVQNGYQQNYVFSHTILDAIDDDLSPSPPTPPDPLPPPPPPPPPPITRRTVVTANATGGGLEFLKRDKPPLAASGGGFSGLLEVTNVVEYEVPPNPNPPPDPTPPDPTPPDPGGLKIDWQLKGSGLYVWVRDAANASIGATVKAMVGSIELMAFNRHTGANVPATFLIGRNHGTANITATTDAGASVTGTATI